MTTGATLPEPRTKQEKAQRVIIGHLILYPGAAGEVFSLLREADVETLTEPTLRRIFESLKRLHGKGAELSIEGVVKDMKTRDPKTRAVPRVLTECVDAAEDEHRHRELGDTLADYVRHLREGFQLTQLKKAIAGSATYEDAMRAVEDAAAWGAGPIDRFRRPVSQVVEELIETQIAIKAGQREPGYPWGIAALDESMPIEPGKLYTVAAQKAGGKTKLLVSTAVENLFPTPPRAEIPCLFLSMEMSDLDILKYMISHQSGIDSSLILGKGLPNDFLDELEHHGRRIAAAPLEIDSSPYMTVRDLVSRIRHWKLARRVPDHAGLVLIDFLQRIVLDRQNGQANEATALREASYELARAAKSLGVAIVTAAQLNKSADGERPHIGHIEGSGGPAQASDGVLLLDLKRLRLGEERSRGGTMDELDIIIAKNRNGESRVVVPCMVDLRTGTFYDRSTREEPALV